MPKFLSLPWDVPEGKGNFHFRRPPNLCPFLIPGMCQVKKGILIPQSLILPEERGGGVGMMKQPELLQPGIGKLEQQPHLGHGEGGKTLRKRLKLFQRKIRKASCAKNPLFHPICLQQNSLELQKRSGIAPGKENHSPASLSHCPEEPGAGLWDSRE